MKMLGRFDEHIDNGGISILKTWSHSSYQNGRKDKQILEDLGKMFIEASTKL